MSFRPRTVTMIVTRRLLGPTLLPWAIFCTSLAMLILIRADPGTELRDDRTTAHTPGAFAAPRAEGERPARPLFGSEGGHPWDELHEIFYARRFDTGDVYDHPHALSPP